MKKVWLYWVLGPLVFVIVLALYSSYFRDDAVIKYFPLAQSSTFSSYDTKLEFESPQDEDEYEIKWEMFSDSNQSMYLRQDVSLLYVNGRLKGIMNKWKENASVIEKKTSLHGEDSKRYEAISFHHGEIHEGEKPIQSIQATSNATLYVIDSPLTKRSSFHVPSTPEEKEWKETLDHSITQQLEAQWHELLRYYQIPKNQYTLVPLTHLGEFKGKPFPGTTEENYERIKGQLWEGLYKNYILGISNAESSHPIQSYIPLILFDNNGKHLMVLFEDDKGKKHQLIQYY
ncbi:hypothetical protein CEH05_12475 [Halobacillus halophilus]|uniref:Uncharacterized protein n=1 Tax=Halobacillus halophilus (strain ATCC 35676 / DSM 2266 / JCM 20832 / KCTC 3685 / LMG 17431 / NBRC 102448 / NCIMB 2269) TaxID=866895 RepID=I0JNZ7_HALH3|nr:hypothetical protein [Halobacillus halophilus]ASF39912.1 hypothetical protein CEH05_12475 [Halobacillus halophilus]CCG45867.1 hypothetical protein HBHAL_3522 [Halobacillus halophilus DSM 2266]